MKTLGTLTNRNQRCMRKRKNSIKKYGFIDPVTVRTKKNKKDFYEIIDGYHRVKACRELKIEKVPCVILNNVSDSDARAIGLIMNEMKGQNNPKKLGKVFEFLSFKDDLNLDVLPFEEFEVDDIMAFTSIEETDFSQETGGVVKESGAGKDMAITLTLFFEKTEEMLKMANEMKERGIKFKAKDG